MMLIVHTIQRDTEMAVMDSTMMTNYLKQCFQTIFFLQRV